MKITRLRITIEPWHLCDSMKELRVEAIVDETVHTVITPFEDDDFESRFDCLMEQSRREIVRLVKACGVKRSNAPVSEPGANKKD